MHTGTSVRAPERTAGGYGGLGGWGVGADEPLAATGCLASDDDWGAAAYVGAGPRAWLAEGYGRIGMGMGRGM